MPRTTTKPMGGRRQRSPNRGKAKFQNMEQTVTTEYQIRPNVASPSNTKHLGEDTSDCDSVRKKDVLSFYRSNNSKSSVPIRSSETDNASLETIEIVCDGVKSKQLTDEEANAPFGVPVIFLGEEDKDYATFSIDQAAAALKLTTSNVIDLIEAGKLVGLDLDTSNWRVPKAQIRDGAFALGLEKVKDTFMNNENLWQYLVTEQFGGDGWIRPLDVHFSGNIDLALRMADHLDTVFL